LKGPLFQFIQFIPAFILCSWSFNAAWAVGGNFRKLGTKYESTSVVVEFLSVIGEGLVDSGVKPFWFADRSSNMNNLCIAL
jgi:hypothetical protein